MTSILSNKTRKLNVRAAVKNCEQLSAAGMSEDASFRRLYRQTLLRLDEIAHETGYQKRWLKKLYIRMDAIQPSTWKVTN